MISRQVTACQANGRVTTAPKPDWGHGHYERTAAQLMPAARVVVEHAAPIAGERVLDVGCGTGNAALLAAERGARVTGVDPAPRLLEVARAQAAERGLTADFVAGDAAALPLADGEADLVLSLFGVIFAPDAAAAAAELGRVTAPAGRVVFTAWIPEGAISRMNRLAREAVARALGMPPAPPPFAWHEHEALDTLLRPLGFEVSLEEHQLPFTGASARDFLDAELANHPVALAGRAVLEPRGELAPLRERMLDVLEEANEDPDAFRVTSRYLAATATRD
jgi:SAM-dependent methyltransferase